MTMDIQKRNDERKGMLAASVAYTIFGFSYLFSKTALNLTEPLILLLARFSVTFLILNLLVLTKVCHVDFKSQKRYLLYPMLAGLMEPCLYFVLESYGLSYTTTSFTGMLSATTPIISAIASAIILREIPNLKQWVSIVLSICGVLMVSIGGSGGENTVLGVLCLVGAYLCGTFYHLTVRSCAHRFTPFEMTYLMFSVGFAFFTSMAFATYRGRTLPMLVDALSHTEFIVSVLYLGIGASVIAYFLVNVSLSKLPVARSTIFGNLSTVVSVASGVVIMRDPFSLYSAFAFLLILCGIFGVNFFKTKEM